MHGNLNHKPPLPPVERRQFAAWKPARKPDRLTRLVPLGLIGFVTVVSVTLIYGIIIRGPDTHTNLENSVPAGYNRTEPQYVMLLPEPTLAPTATPKPPPTATPTLAPGVTPKPTTPPTAVPTAGATATPRAVSFAQDVLPVLKTGCQMCHGQAIAFGGVSLVSYQSITEGKVQMVVPGKPDQSLLVGVLEGKPKLMPPSGPLTDQQIALMKAWVLQGASNN